MEQQTKAEILREAAEDLRTNAAKAWGGDRPWYTTANHVGDLAAGWLEELAEEDENV